MTVFLEKVRQKTLFSAFEPIITEPLELIYLQTVLSQENIPSYIIDPLFEMKAPDSEVPDLIILSGYNVAEDLIIKTARRWRKTFPSARIMVSGVHAQLNREVFQDEAIDYIFFSQSLETYRGFIRSFMRGEAFHRGVDVFYIESDAPGREKGIWIPGEQDILEKEESIIPDRKFFESVKNRTRYIDKKSLALVKGGSGCPYGCSFCYCRLLNSGRYLRPDYEKLMEEINAIDSEHIWIIDDSFLITREDALDFIRASRKYSHNYGTGNACTTGSAGTTGSTKSLIAYLRADFVVENEDLIPELRECGLREIITGFESPDADTLRRYNKGQSSGIYQKLTEILKREDIELTALFIVDPQYSVRDFIRLFRYIKKLGISLYTLSIMTPLKGTSDYEDKKHMLTASDPGKFDFLHLVMPSRLPKWLFYALFYAGHLRLLKSRRIRNMIRALIFKAKED